MLDTSRIRSRVSTVVGVFFVLALVTASARAAVVIGTGNADTLGGSNDADVIFGDGDFDQIFGRGGNDGLYGGDDGDTMFGGGGQDRMELNDDDGNALVDDDGRSARGEKGDLLFGSPGGDLIISADGEKDKIDCGADFDVVISDPNDKLIGCELVISKNGQTLQNIVFLPGSPKADTIVGPNGVANFIAGKNGADTLRTGDMGGLLLGGKGRDSLIGGPATETVIDDDSASGDTISTGDDDDFVFSADGGNDTIDCGAGAGDDAVVDPNDVVVGCENVTVVPFAT